MKKIVVGADPFGFGVKEAVKKYLLSEGFQVEDVGTTEEENVDYFVVGERVGRLISSGEKELGFIFCGTGMGVNIVANKFPGVYCGLCESIQTARLCRIINNCNVLSIGGLIKTEYTAVEMVKAFLAAEFAVGFPEADPDFLRAAFTEVQAIEQAIEAKRSE